MRAIYKRELQSYFYTPTGYVFMGVFFAVAGILFTLSHVRGRSSEIMPLLGQFSFMWLLLCPVLTMRLLAGERLYKTDRLLLSVPIASASVVLGKFFAACTVLAATAALSLLYVLGIAFTAPVYASEVISSYSGFILLGCSFIALDMAVSSRARSLTTSALLAFGANMVLWMLDLLSDGASGTALSDVLDFVSLYARYEPLIIGQFSLSSVVYFAAFSALMLYFATRSLDARRYAQL